MLRSRCLLPKSPHPFYTIGCHCVSYLCQGVRIGDLECCGCAATAVIAPPRHYAAHSGPERTRHKVNIDPGEHDLWDTTLLAFRGTIAEGDSDSIMCFCNAAENVPACASKILLDNITAKFGTGHGLYAEGSPRTLGGGFRGHARSCARSTRAMQATMHLRRKRIRCKGKAIPPMAHRTALRPAKECLHKNKTGSPRENARAARVILAYCCVVVAADLWCF